MRNIGVAILFALLGIFIIVWLAYTIYLLKSDPPLANAYVATGTLILAMATVLLAGFTWLSIRSGEKREKRDRKERLLNEIIEWAVDVAVCAFSVPPPLMFEDIIGGLEAATVEKMVRRVNLTTYTNLRLSYQILTRKSEYIENIASSLSGNLDYAVKRLRKQINNVISALKKCARDPDNKDRSEYKNLVGAEDLLHKEAEILIKEATKIKTGDMG